MSLKESLKKEGVGTKAFNALMERFPEETKRYFEIRDSKRGQKKHRKLKVFEKEVLNEIAEKYKDGEGLCSLAETYKTSPLVIKRNFKEAGIPLRSKEDINKIQGAKKCPVKTEEEWRAIYATYLKERSLHRACAIHNTSTELATRIFNELGLKTGRLPCDTKYQTKFGLRSLYNDDWSDLCSFYKEHSISETEEHFGLNRRRIYLLFKKLGYKRRTREEERELRIDKRWEGSFENLKKILKGYTILDEFTGLTKKGKYIKYNIRHDECGRTFKRTLHDPTKIRCYHCYPKSRDENFVGYLLDGTDAIRGDRALIAPNELDFYIPSKKVAIEVNGKYWHSELFVPRKYHENKTEACLEQGVRLFHFWEDQDQEIIKSRIKQILGTSERIFARRTEAHLVPLKERRKFFNKTHISGDAGALFAIGLYYQEELVSCLSFRKHKEGLEIARYSSKLGFSVVGGFSKLFKFAIQYIKSNYKQIDAIVTYCNRDWTANYKDSVYFKNGFEFIRNTGPMMAYYNQVSGETESREKYQKHRLKEIFPEYNGENVNEFLKNKGIVRIYNSGNWKFKWRIS